MELKQHEHDQEEEDVVDVFESQFQSSIELLREIMSNEPGFLHDLQFAVSSQGKIYHMDYDRIVKGRQRLLTENAKFQNLIQKTKPACLQLLEEMKYDAVH